MVKKQHQFGSGIAEFTIVAIPVILLGLSAIELASWLNMRQIISMALINAGRAASSQYAQPQVIADVFEHNLRMAYPNDLDLKRRLEKTQKDLNPPWQIKIISPSPKAFNDHKSNLIYLASEHSNKLAINNYYQDLQHASNIQRGWPQGKGPVSNIDIFQANTLTLELTWPQQPLLPGIKHLIMQLSPLFNHKIISAGYLPFVRTISLSMQSHPIQWQDLADQRVIYADSEHYLSTSINIKPICTNENGLNCTYAAHKINGDTTNGTPSNKHNLKADNDYDNKSKPPTDTSNNNDTQEFPSDDIASCDIAY